MRVPVFVESWQHQCCGTPFAVGSRVAWRLTVDEGAFVATAVGGCVPPWSERLAVLGPVPVVEPDPELGGAVVGVGGLRVFVRSDSALVPAAHGLVVRGPLLEDHHVGVRQEVAPTRGLVHRVRLVRLGHQHGAGLDAFVPRPGDAELEDVTEAEKWPPDDVRGRQFAGFLVDLDVTGSAD